MSHWPRDTPDAVSDGEGGLLIPISSEEAVALVVRGHYVEAAFGTGGMALKWRAGEPMPRTVKVVGLMRGLLNENMHGAGI